MPQQFKLPCPQCSTPHIVSQSQAGESLSCGCGKSLVVPTLRELRTLEPAVEAHTPDGAPDWDIQRGLLFVGGALLITIGALITWRVLPQRQALNIRQPTFQEIDFDVQMLTLLQAWEAWEHFRQQKLEFRATPEFLENREQFRELSIYLYVAWALATIGLLLVVGTALWPRRPSPAAR
jgi:hypothetical protein